ncbi:hypothetical protein HaLaN_25661, partial [Haematococcus lacustris]
MLALHTQRERELLEKLRDTDRQLHSGALLAEERAAALVKCQAAINDLQSQLHASQANESALRSEANQ